MASGARSTGAWASALVLVAVACRVGEVGGVDAPAPFADAAVDAPPDATPDAPPDAALDAAVHACPGATPVDCSPGTGTGEGGQCRDGPSCFVARVQGAVNATIAAHPTWFRFDDTIPCWIVLDGERYLDAVVADLIAHDLCAMRDPNAPGEEVTVKHDNAFSENFDILASTGCARSGAAIYTGYCAPAWW